MEGKSENKCCDNTLCDSYTVSVSGCKKMNIKDLDNCEIYDFLNPKHPPNKLKDEVSSAEAWNNRVPTPRSSKLVTMSIYTFNRMAAALGCRYCSIKDDVGCPGDDTIGNLQICYDHWLNFIAEDNKANGIGGPPMILGEGVKFIGYGALVEPSTSTTVTGNSEKGIKR